MRTFEYRLYVTKAQSRRLLTCLRESRVLYNEMLETLSHQYEQDGTFPSKYDLTARFKGRGGEHIPATTVQTLADRLSKALERYLAAKQLGLPAVGFPRFKKPNRWHSIQLRQKTLRRKQRQLSRRALGSHRRRKAAKNVAKTHLKISRQH